MSLRIAQSFAASYDALTASAVAFDRSASDARIRVTGPDRMDWLQGLLTNDMAPLQPGEGCYAAYLTPQGRMIGDMRVFQRGDDVLLDVTEAAREALLSRLDQFIIMEDVALADVSAQTGCVGVAGPKAAGRLAAYLGLSEAELEVLPEYHQRQATVDGADGFVAGSRELGQPGFDVYLPMDAAERLLEALRADGLGELDDLVATTARIEAGRPRFGVDMDTDTIPLEAGIEHRAISLTKGCYVGQEIIIRVLHRGQGRVARRICRLVSALELDGASAGDGPWLVGDEVRRDGKVVGRVTSAGISPARQRAVALAVIARDAMAPGTRVEVGTTVASQDADVEALDQQAAPA